ncbi:MAG: hypothetical protein ACRDRN_16625 [Sciscionella sp.]
MSVDVLGAYLEDLRRDAVLGWLLLVAGIGSAKPNAAFSAPPSPMLIWARWSSPMRTRSPSDNSRDHGLLAFLLV